MSQCVQREATLPRARPAGRIAARAWSRVTVAPDIAALADEWRDLESRGLATPYQAYGWVRPFVETVGHERGLDIRIVVVRDAAGVALAILPFEVTRRWGVRFASFIGGKHANYHMGLYDRAFAAALDEPDARALLAEIADALGGLDAFAFVNQPQDWNGVANPMAGLATGASPSAAYKIALTSGDCNGMMRRSLSAHAQKRIRNKRNRLASFGQTVLIRASQPDAVAQLVDVFLTQKAVRFDAMGIPNPFAGAEMRRFLEAGAARQAGHAPVLEFYGLEVGGRCVATYIGAVHGKRFSGMATSFEMEGEIAKASPGEVLLIDLIEQKCRDGITVLDLGVGEARYKTAICDDKDDLVDTFLPVTLSGQVFAVAGRVQRTVKRRIKASPRALKWATRAAGWFRRERPTLGED